LYHGRAEIAIRLDNRRLAGIMEGRKDSEGCCPEGATRSPEKREERTNEQAGKRLVLLCPLFLSRGILPF
jgi:hypothetical protein